MTFTIEQLERYVQAIDLYESDEAKWLRDKGLEHRRLLIAASPELSSFALAIDDAKAELAVNSVEIARQLIAAEAKLKQLKEQIENLADWHDVKASKARAYPHPQEKERFIGKAETHETARNKLTQILEGNA